MILVTGGTGMTGQYVVNELVQRGHAVRVLARASSQDKVSAHAQVAAGDLADFASLHRACANVTGIIHVACTFTDALIDVAAIGVLLENWREGPFIFISSLDVYGFPRSLPVTEESQLREDYSDYGRGKVICEQLLAAKAQQAGRHDYAMLRAPYIWGPHPKAYQRLVSERIRTGKAVVLPGADSAEWSQYGDAWIDVRDLAWVVAECLERTPSGPLNVLAGHFAWHELYAELIHLTSSASRLIHKPLAEIDRGEIEGNPLTYAQTWRFSSERLQQLFHFQPRYSLQTTLAEVVAINQ